LNNPTHRDTAKTTFTLVTERFSIYMRKYLTEAQKLKKWHEKVRDL